MITLVSHAVLYNSCSRVYVYVRGRIRCCGTRSVITRHSILPLFTVGRFPLVSAAASAPFVNNNCHFAFSGASAAAVINQRPPTKYRVSPSGNYILYTHFLCIMLGYDVRVLNISCEKAFNLKKCVKKYTLVLLYKGLI